MNQPIRHSWSDCKLAFISGLSNPESCRLSEQQHQLLSQLAKPEHSTLFLNFPYIDHQYKSDDSACPPGKMPGLTAASVSNAWQFLKLRSSSYRSRLREHWQSITQSCRSLNLISLSSGFEIIRYCVTATAKDCKLNILSLGTVALGPIRFEATIRGVTDAVGKSASTPIGQVQCLAGTRDWISRSLNWSKLACSYVPNVGHMDYLESPQSRRMIEEWACSSISAS